MPWSPTLPVTLENALEERFPEASANTRKGWLKQGRVLVNGTVEKRRLFRVNPGHVLDLQNRKKFLDHDLEILFEDSHLLVVNKPAGLLSVALDRGNEASAHGLLKRALYPNRVGVVHRLDRDTSGLLIFTKTPEALSALKNDLALHDVAREYLAVVEGCPPTLSGTWRSHIRESQGFKMHTTSPERGKEAITHFEVMKSAGDYTLLHLRLETGRKNQIRIHCQEAGIPVAGDSKYGAQTNPAHRLCLHAEALRLRHPVSGQPLEFRAPAPKGFFRLVHAH